MGAAKKEQEVRVKRAKPVRAHRDLLKVSKSAKIMAAFGSLRGLSFRDTIRILGEAEESYKANGRLILGAGEAK